MTNRNTAAPVLPARPTARTPLDLRAAQLQGGLLGDWQRLNTAATIPHILRHLESTGVLDNYRRLLGRSTATFRGPLFADSDLYKTLEALGWEAVRGVREHDDFVDESVELLTAVQASNGYLNTYYQGPHAGKEFTDLKDGHELYCLGHLVQAAIAWNYAGEPALLEIALRNVELVHQTFGPGARDEICGHPQIETALVELSRVTGDPRHRALALRMIELRGHSILGHNWLGEGYYQDIVPVRAATEVMGHAVRQLYLLDAVADVELDDPDAGFSEVLNRLWQDTHHRKLYLTGGLGSRHRGESFGDPFELPADRAYSETCAAIANFHWNWRMLLLHGDAKYADELERGLYNAIAVSTGLTGTDFFYSNPLHLRTGHSHEEDAPAHRLNWYFCACCPPNLARLLSSLSSYLTTQSADAVQVHLFNSGTFQAGDGVVGRITTNYPWSGDIAISFDSPTRKLVELRVPGWAKNASLVLDDGAARPVSAGSYAQVPLGTKSAVLTLDLRPRFVAAHPWVTGASSSVAVARGPIVYAVESVDLPAGTAVEEVSVQPQLGVLDQAWDNELQVVPVQVQAVLHDDSSQPLYRDWTDEPAAAQSVPVKLVPYFRWANRGPSSMKVWLDQRAN